MPGRKHHESNDTRERILLSAEKVFAQKGYAAASIRELCEAAGVNRAFIYYYFADAQADATGFRHGRGGYRLHQSGALQHFDHVIHCGCDYLPTELGIWLARTSPDLGYGKLEY